MSPAIVVLVMVATIAIVILSHPKPGPATAFSIIGVPVHVGNTLGGPSHACSHGRH